MVRCQRNTRVCVLLASLIMAAGVMGGCKTGGHLTDILPAGMYRQASDTDAAFPDLNSVPTEDRASPQMTLATETPTTPTAAEVVHNLRQRATVLQQLTIPNQQVSDNPEWSIDE